MVTFDILYPTEEPAPWYYTLGTSRVNNIEMQHINAVGEGPGVPSRMEQSEDF